MPTVGTTHNLKFGNEYLIIRPNSYQKKAAPTFGARFSTGDPDYSNLSVWQHWVQKCWIGGMGADEWIDDAMFDNAVGIDTTVHEQARLSRTLKRGTGANWGLGTTPTPTAYRFAIFNNVLYCLVMTAVGVASRMYSYNVGTQAWTSVTMPGAGTFWARSISTFDGKLFLGGAGGGLSRIYWATSPGTWSLVTNPAGVTDPVYNMRQYNGKMYCSYGPNVWRMKDNQTWDGTTVFYKVNANSGSNYITAMEVHLGFLYMLSQNGHLHRTDGNNTFDIWSWDGQTIGVSLRSYDGKLFVGTYEFTDTVDIGYGVLYQFTGAAVTELKRWGRAGKATAMGQLVAYGRKLYYGASALFGVANGFGIAVYDAVEDAHSIWAVQDDSTSYPDTSGTGLDWAVDDVIVFGGKIFCTVRGHGVFFTEDSFKDVELGRAQYDTSTAGGYIVSSLYDAGTPGLEKMWRKVTVYCNLPASSTSLIMSYSIDGGLSYTATSAVVGPSSAADQHVFYLNNVRSTRFKWKITLKSTDETKSPTLRAVVVAYLPQPEPNWLWSFTIPVADKWELMDGTTEVKDTEALISYLEGLFRSQVLVTFIDADGIQWATNGPGVIIYDMTTVYYDIDATREADIRLTLLEVVETY